ncbi:TPA: hypothetical protein N0F65_006625 [Lagenidium giganteum]|uniref:EF-hand domain-containing protein n=1 Tax=Lagenidium giganteum TaxID=4803 RepID=A0AAV2ZA89_9STRA|nr:TPA: hypothetical protein N0F65_006625 [Lagenidium giganteum]
MPATEVSPALRRRLSDDARQLLLSALADDHGVDLNSLTLTERLQHFRGQIRVRVPALESALSLRIVVSNLCYLLRFPIDSINAEVCVFNKAGSLTAWITTSDGANVQLRTFLTSPTSPAAECKQITALIDVLELLDLFDVFRGALLALEKPGNPFASPRSLNRTYRATTDKNSYEFVVDGTTGCPLSVTQTSASATDTPALQLLVDEYLRFEGIIDVPAGIKSDVELMIDTAMTCFLQWSYDGQQVIMGIFDTIDKDNDGFISGDDIHDQLLAVGHSETQSSNIVLEMSRLLCDTADPAEEFGFYKFGGFWITMLADGFRVSDPANESQLLGAFQQLFLGC